MTMYTHKFTSLFTALLLGALILGIFSANPGMAQEDVTANWGDVVDVYYELYLEPDHSDSPRDSGTLEQV